MTSKEIKLCARKTLKHSYWSKVVICFLLVYLAVVSGFGLSMLTVGDGGSPGYLSVDQTIEAGTSVQQETGLVDFLVAKVSGSEKSSEIAQQVLDNFKGTGGFLYTAIYNIDKAIVSSNALTVVAIILGTVLLLFYELGIKNLLYVRYMRFCLESRTYKNTDFHRIPYLFRMGGSKNSMKVMALKFLLLLSLAILGLVVGAVAFLVFLVDLPTWVSVLIALLAVAIIFEVIHIYFELFMVPYILAVNPQVKRKDCFALSRQMMQGHIWAFIRLELSFFGWFLLSALTFGLVDIFYVRPYVYQARAEFFIQLRQAQLKGNTAYGYALQDRYLTITEADYLKGVPDYYDCGLVDGTYPLVCTYRKHSVFREKLEAIQINHEPDRKYSIFNLILLFFSFAFVGWLWEVFLHIVKDGMFVNRGMLYGPWLPIYGFGGVIIVAFFRRFAKNPKKLILYSLLACGALEYFTSWFFEMINGKLWWDYSNCLLNLNGRICLEGLLVFVLAGMAAIYVVGPFLDNIFNKMTTRQKMILVCSLLLLFLADFIYCRIAGPNAGAGITALLPMTQWMKGQYPVLASLRFLRI